MSSLPFSSFPRRETVKGLARTYLSSAPSQLGHRSSSITPADPSMLFVAHERSTHAARHTWPMQPTESLHPSSRRAWPLRSWPSETWPSEPLCWHRLLLCCTWPWERGALENGTAAGMERHHPPPPTASHACKMWVRHSVAAACQLSS
jgi:hypothetical protein